MIFCPLWKTSYWYMDKQKQRKEMNENKRNRSWVCVLILLWCSPQTVHTFSCVLWSTMKRSWKHLILKWTGTSWTHHYNIFGNCETHATLCILPSDMEQCVGSSLRLIRHSFPNPALGSLIPQWQTRESEKRSVTTPVPLVGQELSRVSWWISLFDPVQVVAFLARNRRGK